MDLTELYRCAEEAGVEVYWFTMDRAESLSYMSPDGECYVAMNPWCLRTTTEERMKLAHELGHCMTGSFYNRYATCDIRQKHENRADKWAIQKVIPKNKLLRAFKEGCRELWDLAERFGVSEDFMRKAVWYYKHGNMAIDM